MKTARIAITIDQDMLRRLDRLVEENRYPSRSRAIHEALKDKFQHIDRTRLAHECSKLVAKQEQDLAEEGLAMDAAQWPEY